VALPQKSREPVQVSPAHGTAEWRVRLHNFGHETLRFGDKREQSIAQPRKYLPSSVFPRFAAFLTGFLECSDELLANDVYMLWSMDDWLRGNVIRLDTPQGFTRRQ
jgi:hypothetical protein